MLALGLWISFEASAADRLSCKEVARWLELGDLSEQVMLSRIARHDGPVQHTIGDCLGERASPRILQALAAKSAGQTFDEGTATLYTVALDDPDIAVRVGQRAARQAQLTWPGDVPHIVHFDDDVLDTPDWFFPYRDLVTLELVSALPAGSLLAADPQALGDDAPELLGETASERRAQLRNAGFRRLLIARRGRDADTPEALTLSFDIDDLWSENSYSAEVVFEPGETPASAEAPPPTARRAADLRSGWFGIGVGLTGGATIPGGSGVIEPSPGDAEQTARAEVYNDVFVHVADLSAGRGVLAGVLELSGRVSLLRTSAHAAVWGSIPALSFGTSADLGAISGRIRGGAEFGGFLGAGWGRAPVMASLGYHAAGQIGWGGGDALTGADPGSLRFKLPLRYAGGPQLVVDLNTDDFGQTGPPIGWSLIARATFGGLPHVALGVRAVWAPVRGRFRTR